MLEAEYHALRQLIRGWHAGVINNVEAFALLDRIEGDREWPELDRDHPAAKLVAIFEALGFRTPVMMVRDDIVAIQEFLNAPSGMEEESWARWDAHWAPKISHVPYTLDLEYVSTGADLPEHGIWRNFPVEPGETSELALSIRPFDPMIVSTVYNAAEHGRPHITLHGSPRALEELGRHLIALARSPSVDLNTHTHIDDIRNMDGGTVHLVIYRDGV